MNEPANDNMLDWYNLGVKHGMMKRESESYWENDEAGRMVCHNCGYKAKYDGNEGWMTSRFCPDCGAKMKGY